MKASGRLIEHDPGQQPGIALGQPLQDGQQQHRQPHQRRDLRHAPVLREEAFGGQLRRRGFVDALNDLPDQPARAIGDPGGDLLEDPVADFLQGTGDRISDDSRHPVADRVAGVTDRVAAADETAGDRADTSGDDPRWSAANVADRVGSGG